jgi:hypothetical protein
MLGKWAMKPCSFGSAEIVGLPQIGLSRNGMSACLPFYSCSVSSSPGYSHRQTPRCSSCAVTTRTEQHIPSEDAGINNITGISQPAGDNVPSASRNKTSIRIGSDGTTNRGPIHFLFLFHSTAAGYIWNAQRIALFIPT